MHEAAAQELRCPLCEYDLRALTEARCPECGYCFTWEALRDPTRRLQPDLCGQHAERNVGSFFRTLVGGLGPGRFWGQLHPTQPSFARRLVLYWLIGVGLGFVPFAISYAAVVIVQKSEIPKWRD